MISLRTDCDKCTHVKVCKNRNNAKAAVEKLKNTNYGSGPNDDDVIELRTRLCWDAMSRHMNIEIDISCPDYEERRPTIGIR